MRPTWLDRAKAVGTVLLLLALLYACDCWPRLPFLPY